MLRAHLFFGDWARARLPIFSMLLWLVAIPLSRWLSFIFPACMALYISYDGSHLDLLQFCAKYLGTLPLFSTINEHALGHMRQNIRQNSRIAKHFIPSPPFKQCWGQWWAQSFASDIFTSQHCVRGAGSALAWKVSQHNQIVDREDAMWDEVF